MFDNLSERLGGILDGLTRRGALEWGVLDPGSCNFSTRESAANLFGSDGDDVVRLLAGGRVELDGVETVLGSTAANDSVVLTSSGNLAVSAVETAIGSSDADDVLSLLAAGMIMGWPRRR